MGALRSNRKRVDECFNLQTPSPLIDSSNLHHHHKRFSNQLDTNIAKKPRISYSDSPGKAVSRLSKYPKPEKLPREVHAPCRSNRIGFLSSGGGGVKRENSSGIRLAASWMGNFLSRRYQEAKHNAISALRFVKVDSKTEVIDLDPEPEHEPSKEDGISEGWGKVKVVEDRGELESETKDLGGKAVQNDDATEGSLAVFDTTKEVDPARIMGSPSLDRLAYEELLNTVHRKYSSNLSHLGFQISSYEARLHNLRSSYKPKEKKKPEELTKPSEDLLQEPFVPLTEEEEKEVKRAFSNSNRRKILVTHENSNIEITGEVLQCLRPGAWLNDEVINVYLELLKERERREPKKYLNCHFFNTFFYKKLVGGKNGYDFKAVRRWTTQRKLGYGLVDCDKIFVPIHREVHWCLAVINKKDKSLQYLDSLGGKDVRVLNVLARYYADEVKDKSGQEIDVDSWEVEFVEDLPEQQNGFDCGVFMIKYADFYSRGLGLHFSQENMPYFRLRTAKEILRLRAS